MESIIRVIKGEDEGATVTLFPGQTVLGRGTKSGLKLTPTSVSWEHAVITRERDDYFVENLSAHGTLINDSKIVGKIRLRPRDVLKLSDEAVVRFEPAGMPQGLLARRNLLLIAVGVILLCGVILMFWNPFETVTPPADWGRTQKLVSAWLMAQAKNGKMPLNVPDIYDRAWQLQLAGDNAGAQKQWLNLRLILDSMEPTRQFKEHSRELQNRNALDKLNTALPGAPEATLENDDQAASVFVEFVQRYLDYSNRQSAE